jgi:hypothetical protein
MRYLSVNHFERLKHYSDRSIAWIKLYTSLLDNYEFIKLPDATRAHLISLWILAARLNNRIPLDEVYIANAIHARSKLNLQLLIEAGFCSIVDARSSVIADDPFLPASTDASELASTPASLQLEDPPPESREDASIYASGFDSTPLGDHTESASTGASKGASVEDLRSKSQIQEQEQDLTAEEPRAREGVAIYDTRPAGLALVYPSPKGEHGKHELPMIVGPRTLPALRAQLAQVLDEVSQGTRTRITRDQARRLLAGIVVGYWMAKFNHPKALVDEKRERIVISRLRENGDDFGELLYAFDGAAKDHYVNGEKDGTKHDDIEFLLRNRGNVERFANLSKKYQAGVPHPTAEKYKSILAGEAQLNGNGVHSEQ